MLHRMVEILSLGRPIAKSEGYLIGNLSTAIGRLVALSDTVKIWNTVVWGVKGPLVLEEKMMGRLYVFPLTYQRRAIAARR
jgi:hypothetical protein